MSLIEEIEKEVNDAASRMAPEIVLLLLDKWEQRIQRDFEQGKITAEQYLHEYVRMKISLHHMKRKYDRDYFYACDMDIHHNVELRIRDLDDKVKDARRKYYVAKHRIEPDQHGHGCTCRGCNCIKGRGWGDSFTIGEGSH